MDARMAREVEALIPNLRRYARVLVRDPDLADDMVQDCLERAISRHHHFTPDTNLRGWLFTILLNIVRTHGRRARVRKVVPIADYQDRFSTPARQDGPLYMRDLRRAFSRLPECFQEVLILVTIEGMSYEEAAAVADVPVGTIRSRLSRARDQLRTLMEEPEAMPRRAEKSGGLRAATPRRRPSLALPDLRALAAAV